MDTLLQSEPLNLQALPAVCVANPAVLRRILLAFEQQLLDQPPRLEQAAAMKDGKDMVRLAHGLKGAAAVLAAEPLRRICERLESLARANQFDQTASSLADLRLEAGRCLEFIRPLLHGPDAAGM